jgi:uncharacterized lipoprotein
VSAKIDVEQRAPDQFRVRVIEGRTQTEHVVTMNASDYERISGKKVDPVELVRRAFEFLLLRERKEQILAQFDLTVISRYFAEFEQAMKRGLEKQ